MALATFAPSASVLEAVSMASANAALPGSGTTTVVVTNLGSSTVWVNLGTSNAVTAGVGTGIPILPRQWLGLTQGSNTYIAFVAADAQGSELSVVTGS